MRCPRCSVDLAPLGLERGHAAGCERCRGIWLDDGAVEDLLETRAASLAQTAPVIRPDHDEARILPCPACSQPMAKREVAYVQLDRCPGHGTWFDAQELEFVAKTLVQAKAARARDEQLSPGTRYARNSEAANAQLHNFVDELELTIVLLAAARRDEFGSQR